MITTSLLAIQLLFPTALPTNYYCAHWGMTASELNSQHKVYKATHHGNYNYADHSEINPDVYVRKTTDHKRLEYYFFNKKLYKIYVIYPKSHALTKNYQNQLTRFKQKFGDPSDSSRESYYGMEIQHNRWDNVITSLDLRLGAGFIYEVWVQKKAAKLKALQQERKKSI